MILLLIIPIIIIVVTKSYDNISKIIGVFVLLDLAILCFVSLLNNIIDICQCTRSAWCPVTNIYKTENSEGDTIYEVMVDSPIGKVKADIIYSQKKAKKYVKDKLYMIHYNPNRPQQYYFGVNNIINALATFAFGVLFIACVGIFTGYGNM